MGDAKGDCAGLSERIGFGGFYEEPSGRRGE